MFIIIYLCYQLAYNRGSRAAKAWADSDGGKIPIPSLKDQPGSERPLKPVEIAAAAAKISELLNGKEGPENASNLDSYMQSQVNPLTSDIIKACLPGGLAVPFPHNVSIPKKNGLLIIEYFENRDTYFCFVLFWLITYIHVCRHLV